MTSDEIEVRCIELEKRLEAIGNVLIAQARLGMDNDRVRELEVATERASGSSGAHMRITYTRESRWSAFAGCDYSLSGSIKVGSAKTPSDLLDKIEEWIDMKQDEAHAAIQSATERVQDLKAALNGSLGQ